jgi:hypothetical protein
MAQMSAQLQMMQRVNPAQFQLMLAAQQRLLPAAQFQLLQQTLLSAPGSSAAAGAGAAG